MRRRDVPRHRRGSAVRPSTASWIGLGLAVSVSAAAIAWFTPSGRGAVAEPRGTDRPATEEPIMPLPAEPWLDEARVALGERLFHDPRLSGSGTLSCSSCHDLASNGASGETRDIGDSGDRLAVNTPTVFNVGHSFRLGWEGRFRHLAEHAAALIENPRIMGASLDAVVDRLRADHELAAAFHATYGQLIDAANLIDALVTFERSLVTPDAPFDRWLRGDAGALTDAEIEGYRLFKSTGCAACHQGVAVGANLFQRQGVFGPLVPPPPDIVRVPSLRNIAATAPYFHDGSAATLEEAVSRMARAQLNASLTGAEVEALVAFLWSLTGEYRGDPVRPAP